MIEWLMSPLSGASTHQLSEAVAWHGRMMVLAWGICAPLGILIARFWKITPTQRFPETLDNKAWWHAHRVLQWVCGLLTITAIGVMLSSVSQLQNQTNVRTLHHFLGYGIGFAVVVQITHGLFRGSKGGPTDISIRGDHYDMTHRRKVFERTHKALGWVALLTSWITIALGLVLADAPRWMPISLVLWWGFLAALALRWQRAGRCIDTYQAIWGLSTNHPGNALDATPPIGFGIKKVINVK